MAVWIAQLRHAIEHRTQHVGLEDLAGRAEVPIAEYIAAAELHRVHADRIADLVSMAFEREGVVDAVAGAESAVGRGVGVDRAGTSS